MVDGEREGERWVALEKERAMESEREGQRGRRRQIVCRHKLGGKEGSVGVGWGEE